MTLTAAALTRVALAVNVVPTVCEAALIVAAYTPLLLAIVAPLTVRPAEVIRVLTVLLPTNNVVTLATKPPVPVPIEPVVC